MICWPDAFIKTNDGVPRTPYRAAALRPSCTDFSTKTISFRNLLAVLWVYGSMCSQHSHQVPEDEASVGLPSFRGEASVGSGATGWVIDDVPAAAELLHVGTGGVLSREGGVFYAHFHAPATDTYK